MKKRIGAVIIKDKKILLVTGYDLSVYWTPGGKPDPEDDSDLETLEREVLEELGVKINKENIVSLGTYLDKKERDVFVETKNYYFLCEIEGEIAPQKEIKEFAWFSKKDFLEKKFNTTSGTRDYLIPKLIEEGIL